MLGGAAIPAGQPARSAWGSGDSASGITNISFKNLLINTNSTVIITWVVAGTPPGSYSVKVTAAGICAITINSGVFASGDGFNYLIIN